MGKKHRQPSRPSAGSEPTRAPEQGPPDLQPRGNAFVAGLVAEQGDGGFATADADDDSNSPRMCVEQPAEKCRCPSALREYAFPCSRGADIVGM